ncbi:T9SS type A sorting domain-containing protein [bacterium]|nr:T9SS type A sorting domain-containing protein [bacterium]
MKKLSLLIILLLPSILLSANWTFMVYMDGDNNLEAAAVDDFNEMEMAGSNSNVNIVVQFDRIDGYDASNGNWTDCRRYLVQHDTNPTNMNTPVVQNMGEVDMGDPSTLRNFVNWARSHYPASHYCLVLWDHGSGWEKSKSGGMRSEPPYDRESHPLRYILEHEPGHFFDLMNAEGGEALKAICQDETNGSILKNDDVANALTGIDLDVICSDACLQGMLEVAYEWRNLADFVVGSEEIEPGEGYPYDLILGDLVDSPTMSAQQLANTIVTNYGTSYASSYDHKETQAAVRVSDLGDVMSALDNFAGAMSSSGAFSTILGLRSSVEFFEAPNNVDLWDFADKVGDAVSSVSSQANALKNAIDDAVVAEYHSTGHPNVHGLAIYLPMNASQFDGAYTSTANLDMVADHQWDEFLNELYTGGSSEVVDFYEPNDYSSAAYGPIPEFVIIQSLCSYEYDSDYYTFFLGGNTNIGIIMEGPDGDEDFDLYLYDSELNLLGYSEDYGTDEYIEASLSAGQYYIEVYNYGIPSEIPYQLAWFYESGVGSEGGSGWLSYDLYAGSGPEDMGWSDADAMCVYFNPPEPPYTLDGIAYYMDVGEGDGSFYPLVMDMYELLVDPGILLTPPDYEGWYILEVTDVVVATDFFIGFIYDEYGDVPLIGYDEYWSGRDFFYYVEDDVFESYGVTLYIRAYLTKVGPSGIEEHYVYDSKQLRSPTINSSFPNPFNMATTIEILFPKALENCAVDVYDMLGNKVCNLHSGPVQGGNYHFHWNGADDRNQALPSGNYFVKVTTDMGVDTKQIIYLK